MVESFTIISLGEGFPIGASSLQERESTHYVGACKSEWVANGTVDMTFGSQVNNTCYVVLR